MVQYTHKEKFFAEHRAEDTILIANVITRHKPAVVVELGTYFGGIAALFADTVKPWGGAVHTFDIERHFEGNELLDTYPNLTFHQEDVLKERSPTVMGLLQGPSVVLYCDNGNKEKELNLYGLEVAVGALVGCHDYDTEVRPDYIEPLLADFGFEPHRREEFEALAHPPNYPISMTRFWKRVKVV